MKREFPVLDQEKTGENIQRLREEKGLSIRELQDYFNFDSPRAIYNWLGGKTLPSVDHLVGLSRLFEVPVDEIIVVTTGEGGETDRAIGGSVG